MLELMRRHATSWIIKVLLGAVALAFALSWGVSSYYGREQEVALTVNEQAITMNQLREEMARLSEEARQVYGKQFDKLEPLLNIKEQAVALLINKTLLFQAAQQIGISVSEREVQDSIAKAPIFQRDGRFDMNTYKRVLARSRISPELFELSQRNDMLMAKLSALVAGSAQVSPLELDQYLKEEMAKVKGAYQVFAPKDFLSKVQASPQEIKDFYQANQRRFAVPEKVVLSYLVFPVADFRDKADVRPQDVSDAYEINRERYAKPEQVKIRHILINLAKDAVPAEVEAAKKKADEIMDMAKKPKADFGALAKKYSQGPTASTGGDLGWVVRGQLVPSLDKLTFGLKPGEMGATRTDLGYHVIKVEEHQPAKVTPLKEVESEIKKALVDRQAKDLARAAAERAFERAAAGADGRKMAAELKKPLEETPAVAPTQPVPRLKGLEGLAQAAEGLSAGQVLPVLDFAEGSILAYVKGRVPEMIKPLKEVEEQIRQAILENKATEAAQKAAAGLLAKLAKDKEPAKALMAEKGAKQTGFLGREDNVEGLSSSSELVDALFARPDSARVVPAPIRAGDVFLAAVLLERKPPTAADMEKNRARLKDQLLAQKRREIGQAFLVDLRERAKIKMMAKL